MFSFLGSIIGVHTTFSDFVLECIQVFSSIIGPFSRQSYISKKLLISICAIKLTSVIALVLVCDNISSVFFVPAHLRGNEIFWNMSFERPNLAALCYFSGNSKWTALKRFFFALKGNRRLFNATGNIQPIRQN